MYPLLGAEKKGIFYSAQHRLFSEEISDSAQRERMNRLSKQAFTDYLYAAISVITGKSTCAIRFSSEMTLACMTALSKVIQPDSVYLTCVTRSCF